MEQSPNSTGSPTPVRRKYSAEFKASVVEQCSQPGYTTAAVAKRHGIHVSLVRRWAQLMRQAAQSNAAQQEEQQALAGGVTEGGGQMHGGEFYPASACPLPLKLSDRCSSACVSA